MSERERVKDVLAEIGEVRRAAYSVVQHGRQGAEHVRGLDVADRARPVQGVTLVVVGQLLHGEQAQLEALCVE